jgi:peptidoglycan/LPS O-acetylase OafA/YrhL
MSLNALPPYSKTNYRADIDGLRAIAVLAVVAFHAFPDLFKGGFIGVDIFFVISGYLISTIIFKALEKKRFSFRGFYASRIRRIFPALIFVLISCLTFGWFGLLSDEYMQLGRHVAAGASFVSNFSLWTESGYFDNTFDTKPLLHLWSLGIEEQFYIVWPLFLWISWRCGFNYIVIILLLGLASFILNIKGVEQDTVATFYSPQTRFWQLLIGSFLAYVTLYQKEFFRRVAKKIDCVTSTTWIGKSLQNSSLALADFCSFIGLLVIVYGFWSIDKSLRFPGAYALLPTLGAMIIISAGPNAWLNRKILSNKIVVFIGLISFPLYLWHWPLLSFIRIVEGESPSAQIRLGVVFISFILAWLTYEFIERPIRFGIKVRAKTFLLASIMCAIGFIGHNIYTNDGYEFRQTVKNYLNNQNELVREPTTNESCFNYIGIKAPLFPYCKFTNLNSKDTVAVIGDSHAHVAYPGIAEYFKAKKVSTLLLANSSCPPLIGVPIYDGTEANNQACNDRVKHLLDILIAKNDINNIFIFMRGPIYFTGTEPITGKQDMLHSAVVSIEKYQAGAQQTIDRLSNAGKKVFIVTENPELKFDAGSCLSRPFRINTKDCRPNSGDVNERQNEYIKMIEGLHNATIIDSRKAFCSEDKCKIFDDGKLLYADDDHLSIAGSIFQANGLLKKYLNEIAP